jgi:chromosome segregation ATPase
MRAVCILFLVAGFAVSEKVEQQGSAVQKVIELLDDMKSKITSDLEAESAAMEEYLAFCDDETKEKANAIKTAEAQMADLNAIIEESKATITAKDDEVATLGTTISDKTSELEKVTTVREEENADFVAAEKELVKSVDECARAAAALEKGLSLMQMRGGNKAARKQMKKQLLAVKNAMQTILSAAWVEVSSAKKLQSLLQQSESSTDDESLSLHQPQAKQVAYESKSGVIVDMIKEMQGKAEEELSALRKKEMTATHEFKMLEQGLTAEITHSKEALGAASAAKAQAGEDQAKAEGDLVSVTKTKGADEAYSKELRGECETTATEWEARQKSAQGEMGALAKAKEILSEGVKALVQVKSQHRRSFEDAEENQDLRQKISHKLDAIGRKYHSFVFMSLASAARSDPFVKIRGLIEDMIASLLKQAEE